MQVQLYLGLYTTTVGTAHFWLMIVAYVIKYDLYVKYNLLQSSNFP